jgi:hypothetical protein
MGRVKERNIVPDPAYYEHLVAKALLFRRAERIVSEQRFGGYRANIVTYALAKLAHATAQRVDLASIWQSQSLSPALEAAITELSHLAYEVIAERTPGGANVTEWSKREQCWVLMRELSWEPPSQLVAELIGRGRLGAKDTGSNDSDVEQVAAVTRLGADGWLLIADWAKETDNLTPWQRRFAYTIGVQLSRGLELSAKQVAQAARIVDAARGSGFDPSASTNQTNPSVAGSLAVRPPTGQSNDGIESPVRESDQNEAASQEPLGAERATLSAHDVLVEDALSLRASNALRRIGLRTLGQVAERTDGSRRDRVGAEGAWPSACRDAQQRQARCQPALDPRG